MYTTSFTTLALAAASVRTGLAAPASRVRSAPVAQFTQIAEYSSPNFFDGFTNWDSFDPTSGFVNYTSAVTAVEQNMLGWVYHEETNATNAYVGVDWTGIQPNGRKSVRMTSNKIFDIGTLTVLDVKHMPVGTGAGASTGSGLWPALWYLAPNNEGTWPAAGEQDIVEYVNPNGSTYNAMTLHTNPGCTVDQYTNQLGQNIQTDCNAGDGSEGCSVHAPLNYSMNGQPMATAGPDFNAQGGGVYVHHWSEAGINIWLFSHDSLPKDIADGCPDPSSWTQKPLASFSGSGCDFNTAFLPQQLIINIDVCGDWAGEVYPGGNGTCADFAANNPSAYQEAYFEFASIKMYSQ